MKKLLLLGIIAATSFYSTAQNVNFLDANFKAYLVGETAINTNADTNIQVSEAVAFTGTININSMSISDVTGLEEFINITEFHCANNTISVLDLSTNEDLIEVNCGGNNITTLDISNNTMLTDLSCSGNGMTTLTLHDGIDFIDCSNNNISSLDLSNKTSLTQLYCQFNNITSIDLTDCTNLGTINCSVNDIASLDVTAPINLNQVICDHNDMTTLTLGTQSTFWKLMCSNNLLTDIDVSACPAIQDLRCPNNPNLVSLNVANGNNTNYNAFFAADNASLTCIQVDDVVWSTTNWTAPMHIDAGITFSTDCSGGGSASINEIEVGVEIYPNPASSFITIESDYEVSRVAIVAMNGAEVLNDTSSIVSVESIPSGVYIIEVTTSNGTIHKRFIKH